MVSLQRFLNVFIITLSLLSSPATMKPVRLSLWGEVADFTSSRCDHWRLKPHLSIPALQKLTVCFHLNFKTMEASSSPWSAFMYSHPELQCGQLGLGGRTGRLVVWLFGAEWTTHEMSFSQSRWYSLCLTWTNTEDKPALYVNGNLVDVMTETLSSVSSSCHKLASNGTLTLGATHRLVSGSSISFPAPVGKLSLFRLWGRERSEQEVTSLSCTEGDVVRWERDNWDAECDPLPDPSLKCEWSVYEVRLVFAIFRSDENDTELYTARDVAHRWLRKVLPAGIYLNRVSVFEAARFDGETASHKDRLVRWSPLHKSFGCLVHISVIPSWDVATLQDEMFWDLQGFYHDPSSQLQLLADDSSIQTTPVESFSAEVTEPSAVTTSTASSTTSSSITSAASTSVTTTFTTSPASISESFSAVVTEPSAVTTSTASSTTSSSITSAASTSVTTTFTTSPASISELYFEVKVNVSIQGDCDPGQVLSTWLNSSLPDDMMMVLDLQLLPNAQRNPDPQSNVSTSDRVFKTRVSRESCIFQVQVMMPLSDTQEMEEQIRYLLLTPYDNGSVSIATEDIQISRILKLKCDTESQQTRKGLFEWPDTSGGSNATQPCPKNPERSATRHCKLCLSTSWMAPDLEDCHLVVETIPDLDHVPVTADNALDVVEMIEALLSNHSTLSYQDLLTVLNKLQDVVNLSKVTPNMGQALINIISDILESDSNLVPFTNTILNITESVGDMMVGYVGSSTLVAPAIAVSVVDVDPGQFSSLTFGVLSGRAGTKPEIFINQFPFNGTVAFISLPSVLQHSFPENSSVQSPPRVKFQFYGIPGLFKSSQKGKVLNSFVVSASVTNASAPVQDLDEDVAVTLHHLEPIGQQQDVQCVYWNFNKNGGGGGWDDSGCRKHNSSSEHTTCLCDHLTHFGLLLDVSRTPLDPHHQHILTIITYVGCGVSSVFLGVTILTYTAFEKLRADYPSQILINLSLALLGLNLVFLVNSWLSSWGLSGLCVAVASTLHYFLLASFTWMGLEAVNMYFALVKVFNVYVPSYMLKFCALGWGLPLLICVLVLLVNREAYGSHLYETLDNSDNFCWLQDDVTFYVSVVAYAALVFLFNTAVFVVVLIQIRHMRVNRPAGTHSGLMHDMKGVATLTLLLGLTWTLGFLTFGPARVVLLYLFSGLNTLQGLFIFLFHCLMKDNVRKQWRIHLCFGRFRLEEYSEWSHSASAGVTSKPKVTPPAAPAPSVRSVHSSSTESTSASSDCSQRDSSCKRPDLGLFVNSLALPRAQRSLGGPGALPSQRGTNLTPGWRNHLLGQREQR